MANKIALLDGYSLMYRAYHGLQSPMTAPDGTPTNAVHSFFMMLFKVIEDERPDMLTVAFDMHARLKRKERYPEYKANRSPMPEDLRQQDDVIRQLIGLMGIPILQLETYEADDVIGTVTRLTEESGTEAVVVTGDRDSFQLSGPHTTILYTKRGITDTERVTPEWVIAHYGVQPRQLIDVKGLMGDTSDNIPGVPGIGEKTALKLIGQYGSLEEVLQKAEAEQKGKLRERLMEHGELAVLSKELATIDRSIPLNVDFSSLTLAPLTPALSRMRELGLNACARKLTEVVSNLRSAGESPKPRYTRPIETFESLEAFGARCAAISASPAYVAINASDSLTVETDTAALRLNLGGGDLIDPGITEAEALAAMKPLLLADCKKYVHNLKQLAFPIREIRGEVLDAMLLSYILDATRPSFKLNELAGGEGVSMYEDMPAHTVRLLAERLLARMAEEGDTSALNIYRDIELPLSYVLQDMETVGFLTDKDVLQELGNQYRRRIQAITEEIYEMAGEKINLNSPKQVSELLFDRLGLKPTPKKTKSGYSTNAEVLEALAEKYPICERILTYRKYQKLLGTYVDALIPLRDEEGRIHTLFDQVATATGRISSLEPNLQNIPVRTPEGREIRGAFIARHGWTLVDADYSQIELRVLAHMSGDQTMIHAFVSGQDIHQRTAAEVYGVPLDEVTSAMRSSAKAVNFGIVYGISDFSLARTLEISRTEAKAFIERYFDRYPSVKQYLDAQVQLGHSQGYVSTLLGRRRYLPELKSSNYNVRSFGERCAMNSPIQGTAADIIKLAMIAVQNRLISEGLDARLLLQVHDELIIEAPDNEVEAVKALLQNCMENVLSLDVPLKTDISTGRDWRACK